MEVDAALGPTNSFPAYLIMIRWAERGLPGGPIIPGPGKPELQKKMSLMPQTIIRAERVERYYAQPSANRAEYIYRPMSNAGQGDQNPGVDQGVVRVTISLHR